MIIPFTVHLPTQVLPAAGAFTAQTALQVPVGATEVLFWVHYTAGAMGGRPAFQFEIGGAGGARVVAFDASSFAISGQNSLTNFYLAQEQAPADVTSIFSLGFTLRRGTKSVLLLVAEVGVPATPGTIFVEVTGGG